MAEISPSGLVNFGLRVLLILLIFHCTGGAKEPEVPLKTMEVKEGDRAELLCEIDGIQTGSIIKNSTWLKKKGSRFVPVVTSKRVKEVKITGGTDGGIELHIRGVIRSDEGRYKCILQTTTKEAKLYVDLVIKTNDTVVCRKSPYLNPRIKSNTQARRRRSAEIAYMF